MAECSVTFFPFNRKTRVTKGSTLLSAAVKASLPVRSNCGGEGICGRCKMIVTGGTVSGEATGKLPPDEIKHGFALACMTRIESDVVIDVPGETIRKKMTGDAEADRGTTGNGELLHGGYRLSPLVKKIYLELEKPSLENNTADHQRVCEKIMKRLKIPSVRMGIEVIRKLPHLMRENDFCLTATVGTREGSYEVMNIEGGNRLHRNYNIIADIGTTTIVVNLVDANNFSLVDSRACFNSQEIYGMEVTRRIMAAEKEGVEKLQDLLTEDINSLIQDIAEKNEIHTDDITAVICAGNTVMGHFLLALPVENIRRNPYAAASVEPPSLRAEKAGIKINAGGLLYSLPGIGGWIGSDITAGILHTGINRKKETSLFVDIGTNGEVVLGNREWLIACSASAGPALEGASVDCGMRAEPGAIEKVFSEDETIRYNSIGDLPCTGICGSGIIDFVSVLLQEKIINRSGKFIKDIPEIKSIDGEKRYLLVKKNDTESGRDIYLSESDIEKIITAKAAIFAAIKILLTRLDLPLSSITNFYIAGAFGNYLNIENAIAIGLIPNIPGGRIQFVGNASLMGASLAALHHEALEEISSIRKNTTCYDLMGAEDYVEEFRKAMFLPHTDIEEFSPIKEGF